MLAVLFLDSTRQIIKNKNMYKTKLLKKQDVAEGTMAFTVEKPAGFEFKAGQSIDLFLINPPETDAEGNKRAFSLVSAPQDPELMIATRMRDTAFKRVLKNLPEGTELDLDGPWGDLTLHNDTSKTAVFLVGGIGVTPFHSMVKDAALRKLLHKIVMFYSNRRPEDAAFLSELTELQQQNPNYKLVATMTEMDKSQQPWSGETGYITGEMVKKYLGDALNSSIYYIAGPPAMVAAMRKLANEIGINDDYIKTEEFVGY